MTQSSFTAQSSRFVLNRRGNSVNRRKLKVLFDAHSTLSWATFEQPCPVYAGKPRGKRGRQQKGEREGGEAMTVPTLSVECEPGLERLSYKDQHQKNCLGDLWKVSPKFAWWKRHSRLLGSAFSSSPPLLYSFVFVPLLYLFTVREIMGITVLALV